MASLKPRTAHHKPRGFTVQWDDQRRRYIAADENGHDLSVSTDLNNAVSRVVTEANLASRAGVRLSMKVRQKNGKLKTEYVA